MITVSVGADEVTPNTEYTCNITGRIPTFTGVQLGEPQLPLAIAKYRPFSHLQSFITCSMQM